MSSRAADRSMDQSPMAVDPMRQQRRILIFRRHDDSVALEVLKIFRERQSYTGTVARVGCIDYGILAQLGDIGNTRIFNSPQFLGEFVGVSDKTGFRVNLPVVYPVG